MLKEKLTLHAVFTFFDLALERDGAPLPLSLGLIRCKVGVVLRCKEDHLRRRPNASSGVENGELLRRGQAPPQDKLSKHLSKRNNGLFSWRRRLVAPSWRCVEGGPPPGRQRQQRKRHRAPCQLRLVRVRFSVFWKRNVGRPRV